MCAEVILKNSRWICSSCQLCAHGRISSLFGTLVCFIFLIFFFPRLHFFFFFLLTFGFWLCFLTWNNFSHFSEELSASPSSNDSPGFSSYNELSLNNSCIPPKTNVYAAVCLEFPRASALYVLVPNTKFRLLGTRKTKPNSFNNNT